MKRKMTIEDVDQIIKLQNKFTKMYEEQDKLYQELFDKYGAGVDCVEHNDKEFPFIKVEIVNNITKLQAGEDLWKATKFNRFTFTTKPLKKMSKLVEE